MRIGLKILVKGNYLITLLSKTQEHPGELAYKRSKTRVGAAPWQVNMSGGKLKMEGNSKTGKGSVLTGRKTVPSLGTQVEQLWGSQRHLRAQRLPDRCAEMKQI